MTDRTFAPLVTALLLAAVALIGLAHVAFLPPWEGFDETAHWSYVQELADTGHPPRYAVDGLSRDTDRYPGPMTYSGSAPFDRTGRLTLRAYRKLGAPALTGGPTRYAPNASDNWQAQHPPLYYALLAPVYLLTRGWGWVDGLFALRAVSFLMAFIGFAVGVLGTMRVAEARFGAWTGPIMAAWPFLFPLFFPEFARLGNDSLCLLCAGCAWATLARLLAGNGGWLSAIGLGVALGLGLLAKAFFLPIGAGVGLMLLLRWWTGGRRQRWLAQALLAGLVALAIGGWWYVQKRLETGSLTGSDEFIRLNRAGGARLMAENFSAPELVRGLAVILGTFLWAGTWSLGRRSEVWLIGPALLLLVSGADYVRRLLRGAELLAWAPIALAVPMAAGLVYHVFVWMAGTSAVTPGWYFHILAAPLGLAVAIGWRRPRILGLLTAATVTYTLAAWAFQLSMFSGCAAKLGSNEHYTLEGAGCFIDLHVLAHLGHPGLGAASLTLGVVLALAAAGLALRAFRQQAETPPTPLSGATGLPPSLEGLP